jgi:anti-anti-sigma factor
VSTLARLVDEWHDEVPVARVQGEVDASNAREIGDRLRSLLTNRSLAMIVDLSATTYLDSAGINLLFALAEEMRSRQQRLALVVADASPIARMIRASRSRRPFTKSMISFFTGSKNIPLIVKSRRPASRSGVAGMTSTGRRPSI